MTHIIYFISPHGYGHAARAAAVIAELARLLPESRCTAFTSVPQWFFEDSLDRSIAIEPIDVDLGMVQHDAFTEDLAATLDALQSRIPFRERTLDELATRVEVLHGDLVVCDIAPIGLAVAQRCGLPSVLVENFTWDWIYRGYQDACPELGTIADELAENFRGADYHVQTEPACVPSPAARQVAPVSRSPHTSRSAVRRALDITDDAPMVTITMGGFGWQDGALRVDTGGPLRDAEDAENNDPWVVIPGNPKRARQGRVIYLPQHSEFYHPDLIHASDAVAGKLGYSTIAEVWAAGVPFAYVARPQFRESAVLEAWVQQALPCRRLEIDQLASGDWIRQVYELLEEGRRPPTRPGGAADVARLLADIVRPTSQATRPDGVKS